MIRMLYKEILTHKKGFISVAMLMVILFFFPLLPVLTTDDLEKWELSLILAWCNILVVLIAGMFEQGIFYDDEREIYRSFIISVPRGAFIQIGTKYLFSFLLTGLSVLIMFIILLVCGSIMDADISLNIDILMLLFSLQLFFRTVENPFIVRFGSKNGNAYRMVIIGAIVFAVIVYGLFGDLSVFGSAESFVRWFQDFFSKDNSLIYRLTPLMVFPFYCLSCLFSCRLYRSGKNK